MFREDTPEYQFFNNMVNQSGHISNIADNASIGIISVNILYSEIDKYCEYIQDFYIKYSLHLK